MKLRDIINPWGALKQARREFGHMKGALDSTMGAYQNLIETELVNENAHKLQVKILRAEIRRLEAVIATGHYRNPQTGRIGRKGERFDAGAAN